MNQIIRKPVFWMALIIFASLLLFYRSFSIAFFQDDYLLIYISQADSFRDLISFFSPISGFPYRPLATHHTFYLLQTLFGLNPFWYHLVIFLQFCLNCILAFYILRHLLRSTKLALLSTLFYATSAAHYMTLYWIATFYFLQGTTFFLLSVYSYIRFKSSENNFWWMAAFLSFLLGLFHNETVLVLPLVLGLYELLIRQKKVTRKTISVLLPFFILTAIAIIFRMSSAGLPASSDYQLVLSPLVFIKSFVWYILRALSLPEGIDFVPNKQMIVLFFAIFIGLVLTQAKHLLHAVKTNLRESLFAFGWFVLTTMPFLIMPNHMSSYYLEISLLAVVFVVGIVLKPLIKTVSLPVSKIILVGILSSWIVVSFLSIRAMEQTHWVNRRGELGVTLRNQVESQCDQESVLIHTDNIQEAEVTLSLDRGAKVLCDKPNIETQYQLEVN